MVDFRSNNERQHEANRVYREEQDYRAAFETAQREITDLKARMLELETQNQTLRSQLSDLVTTQSENIQQVRAQIEAGLAKLTEDNQQMHAQIQSAHDQDLKLVEQMDHNHRQRLDTIVRLFDQKGLPGA